MNDKHRKGKRTARERLAVQRERSKAREKRRRSLIVSTAVVCVLGLAAVAGVLAAHAGGGKGDDSAGGPVIPPRGAVGKDRLVIPVGSGRAPNTLAVWEDFRCPACKQFETTFRTTLHDLTATGKLMTQYHLVTLIDDNTGGTGSLRAANAAACAQDVGKYPQYHDVLFDNQPPETQDGYADNTTLIRLAGKVPGLSTQAFKKCVDDGRHDSWVVKSNKAFQNSTFQGTPTVLLNGKNIYGQRSPLTPQKLRQLVETAAG